MAKYITFLCFSALFLQLSSSRPLLESDYDSDEDTQQYSGTIHDPTDSETERALERALAIIRSRTSTTSRPLRSSWTNTDESVQKVLDMVSSSLTKVGPMPFQTSVDAQERPRDRSDDELTDPDWCPDMIRLNGRDVSMKTMKVIVSLSDQGRSEQRIQRQYRWYRRQYLPRFRECIARGLKRSEAFEMLGETVYGIYTVERKGSQSEDIT